MKKVVILYGFTLATLIALLKFLEYLYIIRDLSMESIHLSTSSEGHLHKAPCGKPKCNFSARPHL